MAASSCAEEDGEIAKASRGPKADLEGMTASWAKSGHADCFASLAMMKSSVACDKLTRRANHPRCWSSPWRENIPLCGQVDSTLQLPPSRPARGASAIVTNVRAGSGGSEGADLR